VADADLKANRSKRRVSSRRKPAATLPDTPDPIDIAMASVNAGRAGPAALLLENQNRLVLAQIEELRLKRLTRFLVLSLALALLAGLAWAAVQASRSNALVVEPLRVPPALAQNGVTGEALAAQLLDRLSLMQKATTSARAAGSYSNDLGNDLKLVVPQTGVSVGEIWRMMRGWLGNDTRITGEVVRTAAGLAVTVRVASLPGETFSGPEASLDDLVRKSAESIYRATQPYRFGSYLLSTGRDAEYEQILRDLTAHESPVERKWAYNGLSGKRRREGKVEEAVAMADRALAIDPHMTMALANKARYLLDLGRDEEALPVFRATAAARSRGPSGDFDRRRSHDDREWDLTFIARLTGDYRKIIGIAYPHARSLVSDERRNWSYVLSWALALNHDASGARAVAERLWVEPSPVSRPVKEYGYAVRRLLAAATLRDPAHVRAELAFFRPAHERLLADEAARPNRAASVRDREVWPYVATAMAIAGDRAGAEAFAARTPLDCYQCVRSRGRVAALRGDRDAARRWFAEAVRQGPSLPFAYSDWGELLLATGDVEGAIAKFDAAGRRGPRWADPLKYWGDALARQRRYKEAIRKYAAAAERAPRWGALHLEWGRALWMSGRRDEAREKFRAAAGMDLAAAERGWLERTWKKLPRPS
jgi:tetratricopeptide (TPR) repeat protein